jgi:hypothetical protein
LLLKKVGEPRTFGGVDRGVLQLLLGAFGAQTDARASGGVDRSSLDDCGIAFGGHLGRIQKLKMFLGIDAVPVPGKSGKNYLFEVFPLNEPVVTLGAVYIVAKMTVARGIRPDVAMIYLGASENLIQCIQHHRKKDLFVVQKANALLVLNVENEFGRVGIQLDLGAHFETDLRDELRA